VCVEPPKPAVHTIVPAAGKPYHTLQAVDNANDLCQTLNVVYVAQQRFESASQALLIVLTNSA